MHPLFWGLPRLEGWGLVKQWEARCWEPGGALGGSPAPFAGPAHHLPGPGPQALLRRLGPQPAAHSARPWLQGEVICLVPAPCSMTDPWRSSGQTGTLRDSDSTWGHLRQGLGHQEAQAVPETRGGGGNPRTCLTAPSLPPPAAEEALTTREGSRPPLHGNLGSSPPPALSSPNTLSSPPACKIPRAPASLLRPSS